MDTGRGYVRNWRCIDHWQWYTVPHHAHVFQHIIRKANHKDGFHHGVEIKRGQLLTAGRVLAVECGVTHKVIRTVLRNLSLSGDIVQKRAHDGARAGTLITVANYGTYQYPTDTEGTLEGTQGAHEGHTEGTRGAHNNNPKKPYSPDNGGKEEGRKRPAAGMAEQPEEVPDDVWREFKSVRAAKRAPLTPKALAGIEREAGKAGISLTKALTICIERGWQSFRADWQWGGAPEVARARPKPVCACGCGREGISQTSNQWFAGAECRRKVLGW